MSQPVALTLTQDVTRIDIALPPQAALVLRVTVDRRDGCVVRLESIVAESEPPSRDEADVAFDRAEWLLKETGILGDLEGGS